MLKKIDISIIIILLGMIFSSFDITKDLEEYFRKRSKNVQHNFNKEKLENDLKDCIDQKFNFMTQLAVINSFKETVPKNFDFSSYQKLESDIKTKLKSSENHINEINKQLNEFNLNK